MPNASAKKKRNGNGGPKNGKVLHVKCTFPRLFRHIVLPACKRKCHKTKNGERQEEKFR